MVGHADRHFCVAWLLSHFQALLQWKQSYISRRSSANFMQRMIWVGNHLIIDLQNMLQASSPFGRPSKYDPLAALLTSSAPTGRPALDPFSGLMALATAYAVSQSSKAAGEPSPAQCRKHCRLHIAMSWGAAALGSDGTAVCMSTSSGSAHDLASLHTLSR